MKVSRAPKQVMLTPTKGPSIKTHGDRPAGRASSTRNSDGETAIQRPQPQLRGTERPLLNYRPRCRADVHLISTVTCRNAQFIFRPSGTENMAREWASKPPHSVQRSFDLPSQTQRHSSCLCLWRSVSTIGSNITQVYAVFHVVRQRRLLEYRHWNRCVAKSIVYGRLRMLFTIRSVEFSVSN